MASDVRTHFGEAKDQAASEKQDSGRPGFAPPSANLDLPQMERDILAFWQREGTEARSLDTANLSTRQSEPFFAFYDGPPFATGLPHYGHLLAGTIKDIVPRYWFMQGRRIDRRFGWDCHGLPVESMVEDQLGVHGKAEIEALGVPKFNAACRAGVLRYTAEWENVVRRMGRWVDFRNDYKTMDPSFMESVWWVFRQLWDKNLIYEGHRVQPVSPALGTPLSNFEVAQGPQEKDPVSRKEGHKRRQDPSLTVRFKLEDEEANLWAWTTTPWTLPSNLALAVHPEVQYAKVRVVETGEIAYIEPSRLADYQARKRIGECETLATCFGRDLVGRPYEPLFPFFGQHKTREDGQRLAFKVVAADYVTTDSGTGIVHQAPAFGEDDYETGRREGLPLVNPLDLNGIFNDQVGEFAGLFAKDADKEIIARLKRENKIVDQDVLMHAYPHCYRTDQPLLYMAISTWFMRVEELRERLVENNKKIHWVPEHVGTGRFGNWLANARDWNLSRNRYWGTPIPVWRCDLHPSEMVCIGSVQELEEKCGLPAGTIRDLHRESVDQLTFPSPTTPGGTMRRVPEVFDCWFESGSMPYAQNHYPFAADKREYVESNLPADFIAEGLDQTRGWFYTLHVLSTALFDRPAFRNVIVNGLILAADGKKMSKRLKNYPDPKLVIDNFGADALRAYLINSAVVRAEPMRFGKHAHDTSGEAVRDTVRTAILPLWNAYNFLATYARADGWTPQLADLKATPSTELDRWIVSRVEGFVGKITAEFESYSLYNLVPAYLEVCDDLNNWYIRRGRRRYWRVKSNDVAAEQDKGEAFSTLFRALVTITHAIAPVMPFFSEYLYQRLLVDTGLANANEAASVHFARFPSVDQHAIDLELEAEITAVRDAVTLAMGLREQAGIGVRRPLASLTVASPNPVIRRAMSRFASELAAELNVKSIEVVSDDSAVVLLSAKANFKVLGKRLGARMKTVAALIEQVPDEVLVRAVAGESIQVGEDTVLPDELILRRDPLPGRVVASEGEMTCILDTNLNLALINEGLGRELVNRVQNFRKSAGLEVSDRIVLAVQSTGPVANALGTSEILELVAGETLATEVMVGAAFEPSAFEQSVSAEIDGETLQLALRKSSAIINDSERQ
jgi:isoleucyl-tRNA synthetase